MSAQYMVTVGDPFDGFTHYGPFDSAEEANAWADNENTASGVVGNESWWVGVLNLP